jgi:hypothetical protein
VACDNLGLCQHTRLYPNPILPKSV